MDNWDNMRFLLALSRHKTMSAAAVALNTNVATVSRRIERTSQIFGTPLFIKDSSGWTPTEAALPLLRVAEEFDARLASERNSRAAAESRGIEGRIHIAAPAFFNTMVLVPQLHRLLSQHPRLQVDIRNRGESLGLGDADVMLRNGRPDGGRVIARRLRTFTFRAYRSTQAVAPLPGWISIETRNTAAALHDYGLKLFGQPPAVTVSLFEQKLTLMRSTGMAGLLAAETADRLPDMTLVDCESPGVESEIWMIYHATRREDQAIRVVTDWVVECFSGGGMSEQISGEELFDLAG